MSDAMNSFTCPCEDDVLAAVNTGRWPDRVDRDLSAHVDACEICRELVMVARAFAEPDVASIAPAPDASLVWLRAQVRARAEATQLAERPITVAQAVAFASMIGVLGAVLGATSTWLQTGVRWAMAMAAAVRPQALQASADLGALLAEHAIVAVTVGVAILAMPVALYLGLRES